MDAADDAETTLPPGLSPQPEGAAAPMSADPIPPSTATTTTTHCVICLDDPVAEPCVAQPCGHRHFDFLCLVSWLLLQRDAGAPARQPACPLCKAVVTAVHYGDDLTKTFVVPTGKVDAAQSAQAAPSDLSIPPLFSSNTSSRRPSPHVRRRHHDASSPPSSAALDHRRRVYRLGLYARHVGANRHSRYYRELTPQLFAQDPDLVSRARAFLRRELQVFWDGGGETHTPPGRPVTVPSRTANNVEFLIEYIVAILQTVDLQASSGQAEELLQGWFVGGPGGSGSGAATAATARDRHGRPRRHGQGNDQDRARNYTRHFLHELRSFLRSPYLTLASWDRHVQYGLQGSAFRDDADDDCVTDERDTEPHSTPMARGDFWRPPRHGGRVSRAARVQRQPRHTRHDRIKSGADGRPALEHNRRRGAAALQEACRMYNPT